MTNLPPGTRVGMSVGEALASIRLDGETVPFESVEEPVLKAIKHGRGVHKRGSMNKTERAYADELDARKQAGEVLWWMYEPCGLRLAAKTFYHPDFMVLLASYEIEFHEAKGFWEDDARVKIKVAAAMFPFRFVAAQRVKKAWKLEIFGG